MSEENQELKEDQTEECVIDVPTTEDGIPMVVNGQHLSNIQIEALREAKLRKEKEIEEALAKEINGADRTTDPTRFGDWEKAGRAVDFS